MSRKATRAARQGLTALVLALALVAVFGTSTALAGTLSASGQLIRVSVFAKPVSLSNGSSSSWSVTLRNGRGHKVMAYTTSATSFFERGPNASTYSRVSSADAQTAMSNWAGGGHCPTTFKYARYGRLHPQLIALRIYYFLNGE